MAKVVYWLKENIMIYDQSLRRMNITIEEAEEEAACGQIITLDATEQLELLVDNDQYELLLNAMIEHAIENNLLSVKKMDSIMYDSIERFIRDELEHIAIAKHNASKIKREDRPHYDGVVAGKQIAYEAILAEIRRLRE